MGVVTKAHLVLCLLLVIGAAVISAAPIVEKDIFWHVASGRYILEHHRLPEPDPFTFTAGSRPDVHHEWLSQILLALLDRAAGLRGLRVARAACLAATLALGFVVLFRAFPAPSLALAALSAWWVLLQPNVTIRPHLFGWILALVILGLFLPSDRWSRQRGAAFFLLLVLWANLHSSVTIVPALLLLFLAGELAEAALRRRFDRDLLRRHGALLAASVAACLAQPAGFRLFGYVLATPAVNAGMSVEWLPLLAGDVIRVHPVVVVIFVGIALWTVAAVAGSDAAARRTFPGPVVALASLGFALETRRMTFFLFLPLMFALGGTARFLAARARGRAPAQTPGAAGQTPGAARGRSRRPPAGAPGPKLGWRPLAGLALAGAAVIGSLAATRRPDLPLFVGPDLMPRRFPEDGSTFLAETRLAGRMFNPFDWGGYLSYRLYPEYRTLGDGRWILFGRDLVIDMQRVVDREGDVESILDHYGIDYLVEPVGEYTHTPALDAGRWWLAWYDDATVILLRRTPILAENAQRVCEFYRSHPDLAAHARWQFQLRSRSGGDTPTPTSIPSALELCRTENHDR